MEQKSNSKKRLQRENCFSCKNIKVAKVMKKTNASIRECGKDNIIEVLRCKINPCYNNFKDFPFRNKMYCYQPKT